MKVTLDTSDIEDYRRFIASQSIPRCRLQGRELFVPDEFADRFGGKPESALNSEWKPASKQLFDYQHDIARIACERQKYAVFADCGLGKTLIIGEFAMHAAQHTRKSSGRILIVSPLMVANQTQAEIDRFYGESWEIVPAAKLQDWLDEPTHAIGITNYEAIRDDLRPGHLGGLILDESSMLKSHYGKWGTKLIELGRGIEWKLCCTGTPAPNDRIEFANHAVFLDRFSTVNAFLATFFVNRGQTDNRWELKPHALKPFYRSLADFCIFLTDPAVYGWQSNTEPLPPIHVDIRDVPLTREQEKLAYGVTGELFANKIGGITNRASLAAIAKGWHKGNDVSTNKPDYVLRAAAEHDGQSLIWCEYNREQDMLREIAGDGVESIDGSTNHDRRIELVDAFKAGQFATLISKPKIMGFGLNLQNVTRQIFSTLQDSYEKYYQAVKRSNRYGSTRPLEVVIPITDIERPMLDNVLRKAALVDEDTREQQRIFKEMRDELWRMA